MRKEDKEYMDLFATGIRAEIRAGHEIQNMIFDEVKKTNGRVSCVEKETTFVRGVNRHPLASFVIGLAALVVLIGIADLIGMGDFMKLILR